MFESLLTIPYEIIRFLGAGIGIQLQIIVLIIVLYLAGYYSSKLLIDRTIWKWLLFFFIGLPFLTQIYATQHFLFILPVGFGIAKGLLMGNQGFSPMSAFEGLADILLYIRHRREQDTIHQQYEEAFRDAQQREQTSKNAKNSNDAEREAFYEEMRQERSKHSQSSTQNSSQKNSDTQESSFKKQKPRAKQTTEKPKPEPKQKTESDTDKRTPQEVLGLETEFTQVELKKARNSALMRCHPDKWADKPVAIQDAMKEETKRITWAYGRLKS